VGGCLQATLDGLVGDGGLTVAVFEELAEPDKKKGIKSRFLAQAGTAFLNTRSMQRARRRQLSRPKNADSSA